MAKKQLIVIGAGPGGYTAAFFAADKGLNVTLIDESDILGGVCLKHGCIPSKALLHACRIISDSAKAKNFGINFHQPQIDIGLLRDHKNNVVKKLTTGLRQLSKARKIEFIQGKAAFKDSNTIIVKKPDGNIEELFFEKAIIAAGSKTLTLSNFPKYDQIIDSTYALEVESIPKSMLIIGGGYIGLEIGTIYANLGTEITIVEMAPSIIPQTDKDLVRVLSLELKKIFKTIRTNTTVTNVEKTPDNFILASLQNDKGQKEDIKFEKILLAVGRAPNSSFLGLENTKVEIDNKGFIKVSGNRRTKDENIYAIGDVTGQPMLAHKASHEGITAVNSILGKDSVFNPKAIPAVIFTDPEIAYCGLTEEEAKQQNIDVKIVNFPWAASGKAVSIGRPEGLTKLIVDKKSEIILGVSIAGYSAGDIISEGILAVEKGLKVSDLKHCIHPHPTLSETLMEASELFYGESTHLFKLKR